MKREIKFRAWTGANMEYDIIVGKFGAFYVNPGAKGDGLDEKDSASLTPFNTIYLKDTPVMQFTGLKDKNGKEIYEGDVLEVVFPPDEFMPKEQQHPFIYRGQVIFKPGQFEIEDEKGDFIDLIGNNEFPPEGDEKTLEIIGNIYENPELIK